MSNIIGLTDYERPLCECPTCQFCYKVAYSLLHQLADWAADPKTSRANRKRMKDLFKMLEAAWPYGDQAVVDTFQAIATQMLKKDPFTLEELEDFAKEAQQSKKKLGKYFNEVAWQIIQNLVPIIESSSIESAPSEIREIVYAKLNEWQKERIAHHPLRGKSTEKGNTNPGSCSRPTPVSSS